MNKVLLEHFKVKHNKIRYLIKRKKIFGVIKRKVKIRKKVTNKSIMSNTL